MSNLNVSTQSLLYAFLLTSATTLMAFTTPPPSTTSTKPTSSKPIEAPPPKKDTAPQPYRHLQKPELPPMLKPFGMPGVIGLQNGKWEGTDYLGYLSNNIGISVEITKAENVPNVIGEDVVAKRASDIFAKENIVPSSTVTEGPPLPFFHILMLIYPIEKDRYAIVGSGRLFEQIQVIRKEFIPGGFWQGITWENQDIAIASGAQLDAQIQAVADKLATSFASRYRQYNISKEGMPGAKDAPTPAPAPL